MATSVAPEGREAPADPGAAARDASAAPVVPVSPAAPTAPDRPVQRNDESGDAFKERVRIEARERAMQIAKDRGLPGVGAPELSDAEKAANLAEINRRAADPAGALLADATAKAAAAPVVDPAAAPVVDPAVPVVPVADPAVAPVVDPAAPVVPTGDESVGIPVEIAVAGRDDPFVMEVSDQDTADIITDLQRRATRGDQARAIRDEASRMRDETEDFRFVVELDPAGVLQESVTDPRDQAHLAKFLISRPGILSNPEVREFIEQALEDTPERAKERGELMELERLKRRDTIRDHVERRQGQRQEIREIAGTIHKSIESLAPDGMSHEARELLYEDVTADVDAVRRTSRGKFDSRTVPGIIQRRFKLLGIASRGTAPVAPKEPAAPAARPSAPAAAAPKAAVPTAIQAKTAAELRAAALARQDAATATPGRGSEVSRIPTPPAYDPAQPGDAISQRVAWARKIVIPALSKRPVGS